MFMEQHPNRTPNRHLIYQNRCACSPPPLIFGSQPLISQHTQRNGRSQVTKSKRGRKCQRAASSNTKPSEVMDGNAIVCRTNVRDEVPNEGCGVDDSGNVDREMKADNYHGPVTIFLDRSDARPIRFRTKSMCIRQTGNGTNIEQFICRTVVDKCKEGEGGSLNAVDNDERCKTQTECVRFTRFGKFHNRLGIRLSTTEMDTSDDEDIQILNVIGKQCGNGTGSNNGRTRSRSRPRRRMDLGGNQSRTGRVLKRVSRKRIGSLQQFSMFDRQGNVTGRRAGATGRSALDEREKFRKSVEECCSCIGNLDLIWKQRPFLRCSGVRRPNQKLVCLSTFRFKNISATGGCKKTIVVSVVIEEESKKVRDINFKRSRQIGGNVENNMESNISFCSCDVSWENSGIASSSCWHVSDVRSHTGLMEKVSTMLELGFEEEHKQFFGAFVVRTELRNGESRISSMDCQSGAERPMESTEINDGCIAIQLDGMSASDLTAKGNRIGKRWSLWKVIDVNECIMTTVIWRPVSNGVFQTRMVCAMCRTSGSHNCKHEMACQRESQTGDGPDGSNSEYEDVSDDADVPAESGPHILAGVDVGNEGTTDTGNPVGNTTSGSGMDEHGNRIVSGGEPGDGGNGPENGDGTVSIPFVRKAINNSKDYYPINIKRSFMMCDGEKTIAEKLVDLIEKDLAADGCFLFADPIGTHCGGIYRDCDGEVKRCDVLREVVKDGQPRKVTIFTLNHGEISAVLLDWLCPRCAFHNKYRGFAHGLFAARFGIVYTVELLYWYMHEMCYSTNSFRSVYASTKKFQLTPTFQRRFVTNRMNILDGSHKGNRRIANDAIRKFIEQIDVEGHDATDQLYSCRQCEVPMDSSDFAQLGLDRETFKDCKRFKGIVIDAKVVPLLKEGTKENYKHDVLHSVPGLKGRIITNRTRQNALRMFLKAVKWAMKQKRNERVGIRGAAEPTVDNLASDYMYRGGLLCVRAGSMRRQGSTKKQQERGNVIAYIKVIRYYIDPHCCLCDGANRCSTPDHEACADTRQELQGTGGRSVVTAVMSAMFQILQWGMNDVEVVGADSATDDGNYGAEDAWIGTKFMGYRSYEEQIGSVLDLVMFSIVEPLTLGFLPFHTEEGLGDIAPNRTMLTVGGTQYGIPVENLDGANVGNGDIGEIAEVDDILRASVAGIAKESISLHETVICALRTLSTCSHGARGLSDWACKLCVDGVGANYKIVVLQNGVLGRYVRDLMRHGHLHPVFSRTVAGSMAQLQVARVANVKKYLSQLSTKMHPSSLQYWKQFGHCSLQPLLMDNGGENEATTLQREVNSFRKSLYVFPGRRSIRHGIAFDKLDRQDCTKNYFKGNSQIPSFMTVQCSCAHPKLLGFVILKQSESISAALSSVLTHFPIPPRRLWYDNACNSYDSALTRIPWYLRWTKLVVDRFHYTGHTCSHAFNGSIHRLLDEDRSVAAEVINAMIDSCSNHISYLEGNNVIPFMRVLFAHVNACAHIRDYLRRSDLEDDNIWKLFRERFSCSCQRCSSATDAPFGQDGDGVSIFTRRNLLALVPNGDA